MERDQGEDSLPLQQPSSSSVEPQVESSKQEEVWSDSNSKPKSPTSKSSSRHSSPPPSPSGKRQRHEPANEGNNSSASLAASPPRFVALEEIMRAANGVSNMFLSHQIALDENFRLEKPELEEGSLKKQVEVAMKKAFWDILQSQLAESPPNFKQAMLLLAEIKSDLDSFLLPQHTKLKQEIEEILDVDLIKQQAENGALDFQRYAQYVLSVMARLCAPVRDGKIQELTQCSDVIQLFKGIMDLLEMMKLDMANFAISQYRPQIRQHSAEYEKQKFQEFLSAQAKLGIDGMAFTRQWLQGAIDETDISEVNTPENRKNIHNKIIITAYVHLLRRGILSKFPETIAIDKDTIDLLQRKIYSYVIISSVILVVMAASEPLKIKDTFRKKIKDKLLILLASDPESNEQTRLEGVVELLLKELKLTLEQEKLPELSLDNEQTLRQKIVSVASPDNRIRMVVERRMLEFIELVLSSNTASPVQIPKGLTSLQEELLSVTGSLMKIVSFNRAVFGEYYTNIINDLIDKK